MDTDIPFFASRLLAPVAEKKNKFISFRERCLDNHTQFQTKMFKIYTRFQTKTAQKPYPLGRHIPKKANAGSVIYRHPTAVKNICYAFVYVFRHNITVNERKFIT